MSDSSVITLYLLDDHEVVRQRLRALIEASGDITVVGKSGSARDAIARIPRSTPRSMCSTPACPTGRASRYARACEWWTRR